VIFKEAFGVALNNHVLYFFPLFPFLFFLHFYHTDPPITLLNFPSSILSYRSTCSFFLHVKGSFSSVVVVLVAEPTVHGCTRSPILHRKPFLGQLVAPLHLINKPCNHRPRDVVWLARRSRTLPRPQVNMVSARLSAATNSNLKQRTALFFAFDVFWLFHS
jgi:hypothetical protein